MVYTTLYSYKYTHPQPSIGLHRSHLLNPLNILFLLLLKCPTAVGTKVIEYLPLLDLGALNLPQRLTINEPATHSDRAGVCCLVRCPSVC